MSSIIVPLQLIGWKPQGKARRIVLLVSDALPKIAGDGQVTTSFFFFVLFCFVFFERERERENMCIIVCIMHQCPEERHI